MSLDPVTKEWLSSSIDRIFGFPGLIRFSWSTAQRLLDAQSVRVTWADEVEEGSAAATAFEQASKKRKLMSSAPQQLPKMRVESGFFAKRTISKTARL